MGYTPFFKRFEDIASRETRSLQVPKGNKLLPPGEYGLMELYCDAPDCDCRRVIFWVVRSDHPELVLATVNFGWESLEFYRGWMGISEGVDDLVGCTLEPHGQQSKHSKGILALCEFALRDGQFLERIKRHYQMFRDSVEAK